ncbi:MAG: hypothetical protein LBI02_06980 [Opitutaceae bacterium]|nr:hypothetical protein [Opitutaceae bacterium]
MKSRPLFLFAAITAASAATTSAAGRELPVDQTRADAPYRTLAAAARDARPGDTIRIAPGTGPYRETLYLRQSGAPGAPITVDGGGNVITGFEPLPFRQDADGAWVSAVPVKMPGVVAHRGVRLREDAATGRFAALATLNDARDTLTLLPGVSPEGWEISTRYFVVRIQDASHHLYKNIRATGATNDGFNLHGKGADLRFENIEAFNNADEGYSAHDTIESSIKGGRFWANDNGLGNIGDSVTTVENVDAWDNLGYGVFMKQCAFNALNLRAWGNGKAQVYLYAGARVALEKVTAYTPAFTSAPWVAYFEAKTRKLMPPLVITDDVRRTEEKNVRVDAAAAPADAAASVTAPASVSAPASASAAASVASAAAGTSSFPAASSAAASAATPAPSAAGTIVITDTGAVGDGVALCTAAIQRAIDLCHAAGGGRVVVPPGRFLTGTLHLRSRVNLHLESGAVLLGSTDRAADYPVQQPGAYRSLHDVNGFRSLIHAFEQEDVSVTGFGTIDGQGGQFAYGGHDKDGRPRIMLFVSCAGVRVADLRLRNSAAWMVHLLDCERVQVRGLQVWNHCNKNNDMLDIDGCREVTVSDCISDTDDDGITLKSTGPAPSENITITNCVLSSRCVAIKAGTESTGGFRNITISNCVIKPTKSDLKFFGVPEGASALALEIVDGGVMDGVLVSNISIERTLSPLYIRLGNRARPHTAGAPVPGVGALRNVMIQNLRATGAGALGQSITGIPGHLVENVTLSNIRIQLAHAGQKSDLGKVLEEKEAAFPEPIMWGRLPVHGLYLRHVRNARLHDVIIEPAEGEPRPAFYAEDAPGLVVRDCSFTAPQ